jgi:hypothetical protein
MSCGRILSERKEQIKKKSIKIFLRQRSTVPTFVLLLFVYLLFHYAKRLDNSTNRRNRGHEEPPRAPLRTRSVRLPKYHQRRSNEEQVKKKAGDSRGGGQLQIAMVNHRGQHIGHDPFTLYGTVTRVDNAEVFQARSALTDLNAPPTISAVSPGC